MTGRRENKRGTATGRHIKIGCRLPSEFGEGDDVSSLVGATIRRIGATRHSGQSALAIEYQHPGKDAEIIVVRFSELGIWAV